MAKRYAAFISYKHGSILPFSQILARSLRTYATPLFARPRNIFRDEDHLVPSTSLPGLIQRALEGSEYLVLLASPEAASSPWVERELRIWCDELGRMEQIIIVLVGGSLQVDASGAAIDWARTTAVPPILQRYLADVPLFVDLRDLKSAHELDEGNPAFKDAVTKIVARLEGTDPQELIGYEIAQHRRRIRLRNAAAGLLATLTATSVVGGLYANIQRLEQQSAANAAIANSLAAQVIPNPTRSQDERNALLARQAYLFADRSGKPLSDSVNRALRTAVSADYFATSLSADTGFVSHLAGSANERVIASGGDSNLIRVWDSRLPGGSRTLTLEPGVEVSALAIDPRGRWLASGVREDGVVQLWDLSQLGFGSPAPTLLQGHSAAVEAFAFDSSGSRLASASSDGTVRIWTVEDLNSEPQVLRHTQKVMAVTFAGDRVFTGTVDGAITAWSRDGANVTPYARGTNLTPASLRSARQDAG